MLINCVLSTFTIRIKQRAQTTFPQNSYTNQIIALNTKTTKMLAKHLSIYIISGNKPYSANVWVRHRDATKSLRPLNFRHKKRKK